MTLKQAIAKLKSLGSAQTRKTYGRHGVTGEMYGVKYGDLGKLVRTIKQDHDLALELWETGNHDARVLATMIADPERLNAKVLRAWMKDIDNHVLSAGVAGLARRCAAGVKLMPTWMAAKGEWASATGWMMLAGHLGDGGELTRAETRKYLATIKQQIHGSQNRVKYSMNTALIALGAYVPGFEEEAVKAARAIGQVEVDHGLTACQTPLAEPYIRKAAAHHRAKQAKAAAKKSSPRKKAPRKKSPRRAAARA